MLREILEQILRNALSPLSIILLFIYILLFSELSFFKILVEVTHGVVCMCIYIYVYVFLFFYIVS